MNPPASPKVPNLIQRPPTRPKGAPPTGPTAPVRFYLVESADTRVVRPQGDYVLRRGKEIRSDQYDVELLKNRGIVLREISTPGWYVQAQRDGHARAVQLRDAGHDIDVPAEYEPIVIKPTTPATA